MCVDDWAASIFFGNCVLALARQESIQKSGICFIYLLVSQSLGCLFSASWRGGSSSEYAGTQEQGKTGVLAMVVVTLHVGAFNSEVQT